MVMMSACRPVAILFFAHPFATRVETEEIGFAVSGAVDLLALHLPVDVEVDHALRLSVAVLVLNLRALDAVLVAGDPVEVAIAGGVRLLLRNDARLEEGHDILLAVAGRVFFESYLDVVLVVDRRVVFSVARGVLLFDALAAIGIEPRVDVRAPAVVLVCLDRDDGPVCCRW